jgi:hypothetical protein
VPKNAAESGPVRIVPAVPGEREASIELAATFALGLILSVKGDGSFPLPVITPTALVQAVNLVLAAAFAAAGLALARPHCVPHRFRDLLPPFPVASWLACSVLALVSGAVLLASGSHYAHLGYAAEPLSLALVLVLSLLTLAAAAFWLRSSIALLFAALGSSFLFAAWSIHCFPLHPERSDMLPLLGAALERVVGGADPYVTYPALSGIPLTYLPGLWVAFLPGWLVGADLRITHFAGLGLATLALFSTSDRAARARVAPLLAVFVLTPYLAYRHEIYMGVYWLTLALTFAALAKGHRLAAGLAFGWSLATSQISWPLAPLLVAGLAGADGRRPALRFAAAALGVAAVFLVPPLFLSPGFLSAALGYWSDKVALSGLNLSYWLLPVVGLSGLRLLQAIVVGGFTVATGLVCRSASQLALLAAAALFAFLLLNQVVWVYFYPTVVLLLLAGVCARRSPARGYDRPGVRRG